MTEMLFKKAGLYFAKDNETGAPAHGVTNQGIRRSAAQWAGRCGTALGTFGAGAGPGPSGVPEPQTHLPLRSVAEFVPNGIPFVALCAPALA